jgi:hypothetical protein
MNCRTPLLTSALVVAAIGCGGSDDSSSGSTSTVELAEQGPLTTVELVPPTTVELPEQVPPTNVDDAEGTRNATSMVALLERVPLTALDDPDGGRIELAQISMGDTVQSAELAELPRPDTDDLDASREWYLDLAIARPVEAGGTGYSFVGTDFPRFDAAIGQIEDFEEEFGFTPFAIDSFISIVEPSASVQMAVFAGDLTLSDNLIEVGGGIVSVGDGDDFQTDLENRTTFRSLGRPHRVAASDGLVAVSLSTPLIEDWLAGGESLADDGDLAAAATALDAGGSVAATLLASEFASFDGSPSPIESPFSVVGLGTAEVEGAAGNVIVYVFDDAAAADAARPAIETGWTRGDLASLDGTAADFFDIVSVEQDDRLVVVTANVTDIATTRTPLEMLLRGEPLFTHSG